MRSRIVAILFLLPLAACSSVSRSYVSGDGPKPDAIANTALGPSGQRVQVVDLAVAPSYLVPPLPDAPKPGEAPHGSLAALGKGGYDETRLRRGDVIEVTIFDSGEEGLFSATNSKSLALGRFTVDASGTVTLPFVGRQRVLDSTPAALQGQIIAGLKGSAVNPQAVVTIVDKPGAVATVDGAVRAPGRFPVADGRLRVLDAIALAGGAASAPKETTVTLSRGDRQASASLQQLLDQNGQNVVVRPGDRVYLSTAEGGGEASFTSFGAFKSPGEFTFEREELTLAEAVARSGGLLDDKADPMNLYLFRTQVQPRPVKVATKDAEDIGTVLQPLIIRVDMSDASNFIYMQRFLIEDNDVLYVTNAKSVDLAKFLTVLQKTPAVPAAAPPPA